MTIASQPIDQHRPLKVIYIGAGISGLVAAIEFIKAVPSLELTIYEKNEELGGTWYENRYPGCACDIPAHAYQLSFESWTEWSQFYAGSAEILAYWKRVAEKYDLRKYIQFNHKCVEARWDDVRSKWSVDLLKTTEGGTRLVKDEADVLMTGTGLLNEWKWPQIPGLHTFKGHLLHTANWDANFDATDKNIAIIGAGSSGIQVVPALVDQARSMDHYVRGKTWISSQLSDTVLKENAAVGSTNFDYTGEHKALWRENPEQYVRYRKSLESDLQGSYEITLRGSQQHLKAREIYENNMKERLTSRPDIFELLLPDFPPLCKRLTPGPGYLEALVRDHVRVIPHAITRIDETGIVTMDGTHRAVDTIVCATGFQTSAGSGFPIYGQDCVNLRVRHSVRPDTYLGLCTNNFPNFFQSLGQNLFAGTGSLLIIIEQLHRYVAKILQRMAYAGVKTIQPQRKQVQNFTRHCDQYFQKTVFSSRCVSWYKTVEPQISVMEAPKERVTALWPGSSLHAARVFQEVRWDDFDMETVNDEEFAWFGDGSTMADRDPANSREILSWYVDRTRFLHEPRGQQTGAAHPTLRTKDHHTYPPSPPMTSTTVDSEEAGESRDRLNEPTPVQQSPTSSVSIPKPKEDAEPVQTENLPFHVQVESDPTKILSGQIRADDEERTSDKTEVKIRGSDPRSPPIETHRLNSDQMNNENPPAHANGETNTARTPVTV